jgi:hypothetical protein
MAFDISAAKQLDTAEYTVIHPATKDETEWKITFAGPSHPKAVSQRNAMLRKGLVRSKNGGRDLKPNVVDEEAVDFIVDRIIGWTGASQEFEEEYAKSLLMKPEYSWLRGQLNVFLNDDASFIGSSATN